MSKPKFRRPAPSEQHLLDHLTVRPIQRPERRRFNRLMAEHHYLHSNTLVGEQLCYVATYRGQWLALSSWSAAAHHLKDRDRFIGWSAEQCRTRRALLANNARFLILPDQHLPNLASRTMKLVLQRLSSDWQKRYGHPIVLVETFVDPAQFCGTTYRCSGWMQLGLTQGWGRHAQDYYLRHDRPKQLWVKPLVSRASRKLSATTLPPAWASVEAKVLPRCTAQSGQLKSLTDHLARVPEYRSRHALGYPLAGLLTLIAVATFCGVVRGKKDLALFAAKLSQPQLRALRFRRRDPDRKRLTPPGVTTFFRILNEVDEAALELALLAWQEQILGPVQDRMIAIDGKQLRHSQGGELVSAIGAPSGRWLGTVATPASTNEITAARTLLEQVGQRENLSGKIVVLDALHTNQETARLIVQAVGADYLFTVKTNQESLHRTVSGLLAARAFSPSGTPRGNPGEEPGPLGAAPPAVAGDHSGTGLLRGRPPDRGTPEHNPTWSPPGHHAHVAADHQCRPSPMVDPRTPAVPPSVLGD